MRHLADKGIEFHDYGTYSEESCDYPDFGRPWAARWPPASASGAL